MRLPGDQARRFTIVTTHGPYTGVVEGLNLKDDARFAFDHVLKVWQHARREQWINVKSSSSFSTQTRPISASAIMRIETDGCMMTWADFQARDDQGVPKETVA